METIFAIGDIHGCYDKLCEIIEMIDIDFDNNRLVFLGDYIDRGLQSFEVINYLIDLKKRCGKVVFLKGNHEEMLLNYLAGSGKITYLANGGQQTLESYIRHMSKQDTLPIPKEHLDFFNSLSLYYHTEEYIFVHAGLNKQKSLEMQKSDDLLWIRKKFIKTTYNFGKRVIFGHTPFLKPLVQPNKIGIDTGAVYGRKLTCVKLPEVKFYSV